MTLFARNKPPIREDHILRLEQKIGCIKKVQASLPGDTYFNELYVILHRPNWTTPAEAIFFEAAIDSILLQTQYLARLHEQLLTAARAV